MAKNTQLSVGSATRKIYCNQQQMEVYARNPEICRDCKGNSAIKSYYELREKTTANGISYNLEKVDYPITPESVASYAASADYRNDINAAFNSSSRGQNLGSVAADMQSVLSLDSDAAQKLYASLKQKFESASAAAADGSAAVGADIKKEGD